MPLRRLERKNMQLKKIALVFLVVIMMFSLAAIGIAAEGAGSELSVSAKVESDNALSEDPLAVKPGDVIEFVVNIDSNPGALRDFAVIVTYDDEALDYIPVKSEDIGEIFEKNDAVTQTIIQPFANAKYGTGINCWFITTSETDKTGMFITLKFKVSETFDGDIDNLDVAYCGATAGGKNVELSGDKLPVVSDVKAHNYGEPTSVAGDCVNVGTTVYKCTHEGCDETLTLHNGELGAHKCEETKFVPAVSATCAAKGNVAYYVCSNCNKNISAEDKATVLTTVETPIVPTAHKCEELNPPIAPGCVTEGQKAYYVCANEGCGKNIAEDKTTVLDSLVVPVVGHKCDTLVPAVEPDCENPGNVAYYVCGNSDCGLYVAEDKTTVLDDIVVPAKGHDYGDLVAKVPATADKEGNIAYYSCSVCEKLFNEGKNEVSSVIIPKLPKMISVPENPVWVKGTDVSLTYVSNALFENFVEVSINGVLLEKGGYKLEKGEDGSTVVTLEPAYLEHLEAGEYTIAIESSNGSCEANFTVENSSAAAIIIIVVIAVLVIVGGFVAAVVVLKKKKVF